MNCYVSRLLLAISLISVITPSALVSVANSVTASDAAAEAIDAANAATDAANAAAEAADAATYALRDRIDAALALARSAGIATIIDISNGITAYNNEIVSMTTKKDYAKSQYDRIQIILSDVTLESSIKSTYNRASASWLGTTTMYQRVINRNEIQKLYLNGAQTQINTLATTKAAIDKAAADAKAAADKAAADKAAADAKAAADKAVADAKAVADVKAVADKAVADKAVADAKAAADKVIADKAAAELKAKQEAEDKAAAELKAKQEAEAKAAAELKAKQEAEAKAAAEKVAAELKAKQEAEAKAKAIAAAVLKAKQDAEAKAAAAKKTTITCVKGKIIKKVTAVKPVCPAGYKKK